MNDISRLEMSFICTVLCDFLTQVPAVYYKVKHCVFSVGQKSVKLHIRSIYTVSQKRDPDIIDCNF